MPRLLLLVVAVASSACVFPHAFESLEQTELYVEVFEEAEGTGSGAGVVHAALRWAEDSPCAPVQENLVVTVNGREHGDADYGGSELVQTDLFRFERECHYEAGFATYLNQAISEGGPMELLLFEADAPDTPLAVVTGPDALDLRECHIDETRSDLTVGGELVMTWSHPDDEIAHLTVEIGAKFDEPVFREETSLEPDGTFRVTLTERTWGTWVVSVRTQPGVLARVDRCEGVDQCAVETYRVLCDGLSVSID